MKRKCLLLVLLQVALIGCGAWRQIVLGPVQGATPAQQQEIDFYRILILGRSVNEAVLSEHTAALEARRITSNQYEPVLAAAERVKGLFDDARRFHDRLAIESGTERRRAAEILLRSALAQAIRELVKMRRDSAALQIAFDALLLSNLQELEGALPQLEGTANGKAER